MRQEHWENWSTKYVPKQWIKRKYSYNKIINTEMWVLPSSPSRCDAEITLVTPHLFAPQPLAKTMHTVGHGILAMSWLELVELAAGPKMKPQNYWSLSLEK